METVQFDIQGMTCGGCVNSVKNVLEKIPGVDSVEVSLEQNRATVSFDPALAGLPQFKSAVEDAGFEAG